MNLRNPPKLHNKGARKKDTKVGSFLLALPHVKYRSGKYGTHEKLFKCNSFSFKLRPNKCRHNHINIDLYSVY